MMFMDPNMSWSYDIHTMSHGLMWDSHIALWLELKPSSLALLPTYVLQQDGGKHCIVGLEKTADICWAAIIVASGFSSSGSPVIN